MITPTCIPEWMGKCQGVQTYMNTFRQLMTALCRDGEYVFPRYKHQNWLFNPNQPVYIHICVYKHMQ